MYHGLTRKGYCRLVFIMGILMFVPSVYLTLRFILNVNFEYMLLLGVIPYLLGFQFFHNAFLTIRELDIFTDDFYERLTVVLFSFVTILPLLHFMNNYMSGGILLFLGINFAAGMMCYFGMIPNVKYKNRDGERYSFYTTK